MTDKHIFLDTMVFLHYKPINQVDFDRLFNVNKVIILIPRITLRELDEQKNTNPKSKIRSRAKNNLSNIEKWLKSNEPIRENVFVKYYSNMPIDVNFKSHGLNENWNDDILLATVFQYKLENPIEDVCFISQDTGPKLTAKHLHIDSIQLPDEYKLPVVVDSKEKEILELKKTIEDLQTAVPEISVCFAGDNKHQTHKKFKMQSPSSNIEENIQALLSELKEKHPKQYPDNSTSVKKTLIFDFINNAISQDEYDRYNKEIKGYYEDYEKYLNDKWKFQEVQKRTIPFQIEIHNTGKIPADDVDVYLYFPDGFELFEEDDLPTLPDKPKPPNLPRTPIEILNSFRIDSIYSRNFDMPDILTQRTNYISNFKITKTDSYKINDKFDRIKHGDYAILPELVIVFDSYENAKSFSCDYIIRPANLPKAVMGKLNFVIEKD